MELMILVALALWAGSGPVGHWRKTEPLRIAERRQRSSQAHERRMARIGRRGGRPTIAEAISIRIADRIANPRGGPARRAAGEWWADSWLYATERRQNRHARAAAGQLRRQRAARAAAAWVAAHRRPRGAQGAPRRPQSDPWARRRPDQPGTTVPRRGWGPGFSAEEDDIVDAEIVDEHTEEDTQEHTTKDTKDINEPAVGTPEHDQPSDEQRREHGLAADAPSEDERDPGGLASVHPIRPTTTDQPTGKDILMPTHTVTSGETLDPSAGLAFVTSVRESAEQIMTQIELSETTLTSRGVTGEPIALLAQLREAFSTAANAASAAVTHFERHLSIQDQVLADPTLAGSVHGTYVGNRS
jgi:hypothetical protein